MKSSICVLWKTIALPAIVIAIVTIVALWLAAGSAYGQSAGNVPSSSTTATRLPADGTRAVEAYGRLPLSFEANQGQVDSRVKFLTRSSSYSLFLTGNEAVLVLKKQAEKASPHSRIEHSSLAEQKAATKSEAVLGMRLVGASAAGQVTGLEELTGKSNYFIGNDSTKWRTGIPNYAKVKYANVYPGVDLVYYGNQRQLEFDLVVRPGADAKAIKLAFDKQTPLRVDAEGNLVVGVGRGEVLFHKPVVYQSSSDDARSVIDGKFVLAGAHAVRFQVAAYDRSRALVIDPTLAYSTYLGGKGDDEGTAIAVDAAGNAYVAGTTNSSNFPTTAGALQTSYVGQNAFVSKLNATGSALLYSTYLGGSHDFEALRVGIAVDASGDAYITGTTFSTDFPITPGAFQTTCSACTPEAGFGGGAFISKLNGGGSALLYSTYLGGFDVGNAIGVDASGNAYVTGSAAAFPGSIPTTPGAFQTTPIGGNSDGFVTKLNAAGSALIYSTYLGGTGTDESFGIAIDASHNAYVTGRTSSPDFPTTAGAFQTTFGSAGSQSNSGDGFVSKLNAAGSALLYSTYVGGKDDDEGNALAVDAAGNAYVAGTTMSTNFPTTPGAFQTIYGGNLDAFVSKLNAAGSALLYSTYLGGNNFEFGLGIAIDASGNAYVTGETDSSSFPTTPDAFQTTSSLNGGAFVTKLNAIGSGLLYSTYLAGKSGGPGNGIAVDASGDAYVTGATEATDFPVTPGALQTTFGGGNADAFVSKFSFSADLFLRIRPSATTVHQGDLLTYAFPVWNLGPDVAEGEVLTNLQVPAGTTFDYLRISGTPGLGTCTHPPYGGTGKIVCHEGDGMAPNTTWTVRLTVKVTAPAGTVITESAATLADTPDPNMANNMATVSLTVQ